MRQIALCPPDPATAMRQDHGGYAALALRQEQLARDSDGPPRLDAVPEIARAQRECLELDVALGAVGHRGQGLARCVKYERPRHDYYHQRYDHQSVSANHMRFLPVRLL